MASARVSALPTKEQANARESIIAWLSCHLQIMISGVVVMIEIHGLDHVVLRTSCMAKMQHFYCTVLGCTLERELAPDFGLVQLRAGSALIDLVAVDSELGRVGGGPPTRGENNMDHFCLRINPLPEDEIIRHLASYGIAAGPFERRYGAQGFGNSIYLQDPEGNTVELRNRI